MISYSGINFLFNCSFVWIIYDIPLIYSLIVHLCIIFGIISCFDQKPSCPIDIFKALNLCDRSWSNQCEFITQAAITSIVNTIWVDQNNSHFNNSNMHRKTSVNLIHYEVSFIDNNMVKTVSSSISDFSIIKCFKVSINQSRAPKIIEGIWYSHAAGG